MRHIGEENINHNGNKMILIKYINNTNISVLFPSQNYIVNNTSYVEFTRGTIKSPYDKTILGVGYLGEGKYRAKTKNIFSRQYKHWSSMLTRVYSVAYSIKKPTYVGCSVCEEWHDFQNFGKWYDDNYYEINDEKMCLDKDILHKGNKVYSPENCVFVPQNINSLVLNSKAKRGECLIGVSYHKATGKFRADCSILDNNKKKQKQLGTYSTEIKAFNEYKKFKEKYIKQFVENYKSKIPNNLYNALINWNIDISD